MVSVEYFDSGSGTWTPINYGEVSVTFGISDVTPAPTATVTVARRTRDLTAADRLRVKDDAGDVVFVGGVERAPTRRDGTQRVELEHDLWTLLEETVSIAVSNPTDEQVYQAAINAADTSGVTLSYAGSATSLSDDYEVDGRTVKRVFRDMTDRTGRVWWIGTDDTINVETRGGRGQWTSIDTATDAAVVTKYDGGDRSGVVNDVAVIGTGDVAVTGSASDNTSISTYGRQPQRVNVSYITSQAEADAYASALLIPDPLASAEVVVGDDVGDVTVPRVNQTLAVTDDAATGVDDTLPIEKHVFEDGPATMELGQGAGVNTARFNREQKSSDDTTEPGSVYDGSRLADDSVDSNQLVDSSVIEQKLGDLSVTLNKVDFDAIDETKIQDNSISTPLLQASAVVASKIAADTITANEIAAGTITALEIAADTITANNIDTLTLSTNEIEVGADADNQIVFDTESNLQLGETVTRMYPTGDLAGVLGTLFNRWEAVYAGQISGDSIELLQGSITPLSAQASGTSEGVRIVEDGQDTSFVPYSPAFGRIGTPSDYFFEMNASAFNTQSPEPLSGVGATDIRGYSWYQPPLYATQKPAHVDGADHRRSNPDKEGIDLGHMTNYLFETCKAQAEKIEELEARIDALEGNA